MYWATVPAWVTAGSIGGVCGVLEEVKHIPSPIACAAFSTQLYNIEPASFWYIARNAESSFGMLLCSKKCRICSINLILGAFMNAEGLQSRSAVATWNLTLYWDTSSIFCSILWIVRSTVATHLQFANAVTRDCIYAGRSLALAFCPSGGLAIPVLRRLPSGGRMWTTSYKVCVDSCQACVESASSIGQSSPSVVFKLTLKCLGRTQLHRFCLPSSGEQPELL